MKYYKVPKKKFMEFYETLETKNPTKILILMILSFGTYGISWIYLMNKKLLEIDDDSPNPNRGAIILYFMPVTWYFVMIIIEKLIFSEQTTLTLIIKIFGWGLIIFLSLQYIYEFCTSFGEMTRSNQLVWYLSIYTGYIGIILTFFEFYYLFPLYFFTLSAIPAMQAFINRRALEFELKNEHEKFNVKVKKYI